MEKLYRNFYRSFYLKTGGFIPARPLNENIYPGDFFQIINGEMVILGNIFRKGIVRPEEAILGNGSRFHPSGWVFSDGVNKQYSGRGTGHGPVGGEFEFSKQLLVFEKRGSFFFHGNDPVSVSIRNWSDLQQQLIIKMTQTIYSFRDLYIVTESAALNHWTLAVSGSDKGELEIATDAENFGLVDIFGLSSVKTIQSRDIEYYHREAKRKPVFFRAKKLVVQPERIGPFINELISQEENRHEWAGSFFREDFHYEPVYPMHPTGALQSGVLDMLQANELNPNTALLYFRWEDANLDDIEKCFISYES